MKTLIQNDPKNTTAKTNTNMSKQMQLKSCKDMVERTVQIQLLKDCSFPVLLEVERQPLYVQTVVPEKLQIYKYKCKYKIPVIIEF